MIFFWYSVFVYISVSDQNLTPKILACSESAQVRYDCFKKGRKGEFERSKEMGAVRRSARDTKRNSSFVSQADRRIASTACSDSLSLPFLKQA